MNEKLTPIDGMGIYVHFPWCLKKCPYCDFLSVKVPTSIPGATATREQAQSIIEHERYSDAVIAELSSRLSILSKHQIPQLRSVFFGGGTPSLWAPAALGRVLRSIKQHFRLQPDIDDLEVTVECNPTSVDANHFEELLKVGVNRVSIGVQSVKNERLEFLGRLHDEAGGLDAVRAALSVNVPSVSADLIFGVFRQSPDDAVQDVETVAQLGVHHMSVYALTIEPGTRFSALNKLGKLPLLDDALVAQSFSRVSESLSEFGFEHYEISNFARPNQRSVHNTGYWLGRDYLGLGTGAFGTVTLSEERVRYRNTLSPERYLATWSGNSILDEPFKMELAERESLDENTAIEEALLLGLRLSDGVDLEEVARKRGGQPFTARRMKAVQRLVDQGRLERDGPILRIPRKHWLFADGIIVDLL